MYTNCGAKGNEVIKSALHDLKDLNSDYTKTRIVIDLLFDQKIINEVLFEIQDSHVICTVSTDPKNIEFIKYFQKDSTYHQARANGRNEQEAFFNALSKIGTFINLA
ncbi:MAG: hypothetical protein Q7J85_05580 [Bacillota bacterium]|nr:hypothetical protein [Bacillota bacterium]